MDPELRAVLERLPGWSLRRGRLVRPVPRPAAAVRAALRRAGAEAAVRVAGAASELSVPARDPESAFAAETALLALV